MNNSDSLLPFPPQADALFDLRGARLLIFVVAYNAEKTIDSVLRRIPACLHQPGVEALVIDDCSKDSTFSVGCQSDNLGFALTMLRNPCNQRYGGNQKLGYRYAIDHGFDIVALVHGDGQYAPEKLPDLLRPLVEGHADAVFGSRMAVQGAALKGGMPLYKYVGNKILTTFQNTILGTKLSEFHSGYRLYTTNALRQIPFERNTNDFHFDTEIINQLVFKKLRIAEVPIPTYYGDEICHVEGLRYAWDVTKTMLQARLHQMNLLYDRKFDVNPVEENYSLKLGYTSSHTMALGAVKTGQTQLDLGCGQGLWAEEAAALGGQVTGLDQYAPIGKPTKTGVRFLRWNLNDGEFPTKVANFDQIFMLDIIEHLQDPEVFMEQLRSATDCKRPELILTTANIGFFITRFMLLIGKFNYGKKGILDRTHTRLFTFNSLKHLLEQSGYVVEEMRGIPAPFPNAVGANWLGHSLVWLNQRLIQATRGLFSYQIFVRAQALPTVDNLLAETIQASAAGRELQLAA